MSPKNNQYAIKAWRGAALGLLAAAVLSILWAAYLVFITPPRVVSFMIGSIELRYPLVGGTRQHHFAGANFKPRKALENAQTPTSRVHAVLGSA